MFDKINLKKLTSKEIVLLLTLLEKATSFEVRHWENKEFEQLIEKLNEIYLNKI